MKILYHHRTQAQDAQGIHIREMVDAFRSLGHDVAMVALVGADKGGSSKRSPGWLSAARGASKILYELMGLAYNIVGAGAALLGLVTPLAAAVAMPLSSLVVVFSSIIQRPFASDASLNDTPARAL